MAVFHSFKFLFQKMRLPDQVQDISWVPWEESCMPVRISQAQTHFITSPEKGNIKGQTLDNYLHTHTNIIYFLCLSQNKRISVCVNLVTNSDNYENYWSVKLKISSWGLCLCSLFIVNHDEYNAKKTFSARVQISVWVWTPESSAEGNTLRLLYVTEGSGCLTWSFLA